MTILVVAIATAGRVGMIAWPFLNDSGLYAYMGKTVATGGVLYRDFYETKLPGVGMIAALFWRAFGEHWAGYVLGQLALALLAAVVLARAAKRHISPAAAMPTFLFAAVFLNFAWTVYTGFQLETIMAFFEAVAVLAALEAIAGDNLPDSFAAGLAAGVAMMIKPGGLAVGVAFVVVLLRQRARMGGILRCSMHLLAFGFGVAVPTLATVAYTIGSGAWPFLPGVLNDIERYANATPLGAAWVLKVVVVIALLGFPVSVRLLGSRHGLAPSSGTPGEGGGGGPSMSNLRSGRTPTLTLPRSTGGGDRTAVVLHFALSWFLTDLLAVILQRRMYPYHFLPLASPAALLYGLLPGLARPMRVAIGLLPIALLSLRWEGSDLSHVARGFRHDTISDYVAAHTSGGDAVFTDQIGRLLIETDRSPGSRFGTFFYLVNYDEAPQDYARAMIADFEQRRPVYLVLRSSAPVAREAMGRGPILSKCPQRRENFFFAWREIDAYVASHYVRETVIDGNEVYRRVGAPQSASAFVNPG